MKTEVAVCALCEGTGWKSVPIAESKERRVTRCDCRVERRAEALLAAARIPKRYQHCGLNNFEFEGAYSGLAGARLAACKFVEEYPLDNTGLLLIGTAGLGKTHLAVGIIRELIVSKGVQCMFCDYRDLLKEVQNSYNSSVKETEMDVLRPVFEAEVLVLDELGSAKPSDWVSETVNLILNTRYNDARTTILTTNFPDLPAGARPARGSTNAELARQAGSDDTLGDRIGERTRSRLHEMCRIVKMEGQDFRQGLRSASNR